LIKDLNSEFLSYYMILGKDNKIKVNYIGSFGNGEVFYSIEKYG